MVGPNGAGKSTFVERVLSQTGLPFVNADLIAAERFGAEAMVRSREAAVLAEAERDRLIRARASFIAETVASHRSKVELVEHAEAAGYMVVVHVVLIPEPLAVPRVAARVAAGGHDVPADRVVARYRRLWGHVAAMVAVADDARFYDNSRAATPFRRVARFESGRQVGSVVWPDWTPQVLTALSGRS